MDAADAMPWRGRVPLPRYPFDAAATMDRVAAVTRVVNLDARDRGSHGRHRIAADPR